MRFLPRPDLERTAQDVDEIYALTAEELQRAGGADERRRIFRRALLRSYEAGIDAQREIYRRLPADPSDEPTRRIRRPVARASATPTPDPDNEPTDPALQLPADPWRKH